MPIVTLGRSAMAAAGTRCWPVPQPRVRPAARALGPGMSGPPGGPLMPEPPPSSASAGAAIGSASARPNARASAISKLATVRSMIVTSGRCDGAGWNLPAAATRGRAPRTAAGATPAPARGPVLLPPVYARPVGWYRHPRGAVTHRGGGPSVAGRLEIGPGRVRRGGARSALAGGSATGWGGARSALPGAGAARRGAASGAPTPDGWCRGAAVASCDLGGGPNASSESGRLTDGGAPGQLALARALLGLPVAQPLDDLGERQHVGVLLVHVEQVDGVARLVAVVARFLGHDHAVAVGAALDDRRADAAAGALAADDDRVHVEVVQVAGERRAPERARGRLPQQHLARQRGDLVGDVVLAAVAVGLRLVLELLGRHAVRRLAPARHARGVLVQARDVDHRDAHLAGHAEQLLDAR